MGFKKNELTKKIFLNILGIASFGAVLSLAVMAPNCVQLLKLLDFDKNNKKRIQASLYRLKKQRLIKIYTKGNEDVVEITEQGRRRVLKYNFEEMKIIKQQKWNKIWIMVIFDIPYDKKYARDALRIKLIKLGFLQFQKSVFIYPFSCKNEIDFIIEFFNIQKYVDYIEVSYIEKENKYKNYFNLK